MSQYKTYEVTVERDGDWWFAKAPAVPGAHTQTRRVYDVGAEMRPLIAIIEGVPETDILLKTTVVLTPETQKTLGELVVARTAAAREQDLASELTRKLAFDLVETGLPQRDVAAILDLSFQRVSQLLKQRPARRTA